MSPQQHGADAHDHVHGEHDHVHAPAPEQYSARSHPEFVVLEIGEGVGALIVTTPAAMHGSEIEISPTGADDRRQHKEVLERRAGGTAAFTAVFDGLDEGSYTLWVDGEPWQRGVAIAGGVVAQLDWRRREAPAARSLSGTGAASRRGA